VHSKLIVIVCQVHPYVSQFGGGCGIGVLRLFNDALGHSHSASGHTDCKFLFSISRGGEINCPCCPCCPFVAPDK